jgi:hypothetical protein
LKKKYQKRKRGRQGRIKREIKKSQREYEPPRGEMKK